MTISTLFIILLLIVVIALCWHNYRLTCAQENTVSALKQQLRKLGEDSKPHAFANIDPRMFKPEMQLTVRVKEPIALAKREDKMARMFADFLPALIVQKVYEQVRDEIKQGLIDNQVDADVEIEVIATSPTDERPPSLKDCNIKSENTPPNEDKGVQ